MTLKNSNPHLKSPVARKAALRVSAQSSSAVEGIRAPFSKKSAQPESTKAFISYWKQRVSTSR